MTMIVVVSEMLKYDFIEVTGFGVAFLKCLLYNNKIHYNLILDTSRNKYLTLSCMTVQNRKHRLVEVQ